MVQLTFYKNQANNYYLVRCTAESADTEIWLPAYISPPGSSTKFTYGIYQYAFYLNKYTTTLHIPSTVHTLQKNSFVGSQLTHIFLEHQSPPIKPSFIYDLRSDVFVLNIYYPVGTGNSYYNAGWRAYSNNAGQVIIDIKQSPYEWTAEKHIPYLWRAGENIQEAFLADDLETIGDMAWLGVVDNTSDNNNILFTLDADNTCYQVENNILLECKNDITKVIKGTVNTEENSIIIPYDTIGPNAYYKDKNLSNADNAYNISFSGTRIEQLAFQNCKGLQSFTAPNLTYLAHNAFMGCTNLTSVPVVNQRRRSIANNIYYNLTLGSYTNCCVYKLQGDWYQPVWFSKAINLDISPNNELTQSEFYSALLTKIDTIPAYLFQNSKISGILTIPPNIKKIEAHAFENCQGLIRVDCEDRPDGAELIIEDYAFYNCKNIQVFNLPNTKSTIGFRALAFGGE